MNLTLPRSRRWFSTAIGFVVIGIVFVGFSRTYFLKEFFDTGPLTMRLHLHGIALSTWLVLFLVQARLIATHRRKLHMRMGIAGLILAAVAVATTYAVAFEFAAHGIAHDAHTAVSRLYSSLALATLFGLFVALGIVFRRRPEIHKRLMVLAMLAVLPPGAHRAVTLIVGRGTPDSYIFVIAVLLGGCLAYDWNTRGTPHPALLYGGILLMASQLTRRLVGGSDLWQQIGNWLIR
jgi:hypothetical protein